MTTAIFTHKFSGDTQLRTQIRDADYKRGYWAKTPANDLPTEDNKIGGNVTRKMHYETLNLQSDFSTKLDLAGTKHEVLALSLIHISRHRLGECCAHNIAPLN